ncbi:DNA polymerase III subunit gamma/tau [Kangiella profundi]|uniref:DNA polymerase III subunit gamma/tau n=1 Tax=Kangiella profundi TaxID=1561924 RepID=A0A2K9ATY1_9GAMM|nr:DNA polymerase III subunit gamma/tau [Kangiella profundi]AUD78621.1 DNA polymerase III subunit gamma/tau [Kangiella profundi]
MSYQVLARKWRPKNFDELQGQEHVSRALVNAIESGRLHHAYLFTGTRGVGKTTIARILSKCLNCETNGLTSKPCGECASCVEIDEGRFVDLIEVDAASRTKVDDTRELLENVQYKPTRGRYKVYLIDEVHMLSNSSFNALLKTLEEPPEHVIFLLATTDPQKLPVTVLSRCLQFHLKHMEEQTIAQHLAFILQQESIEFEAPALELISRSAEGSMRDALSLLDQAIAFGQGKVQEEDIRTMLGTIDHQFMVKLLEALANHDSAAAIEAVAEMSQYPVDFADALKELLSRIHQIAIFQSTGVLLDQAAPYVEDFAGRIACDDLQLYYQMGLHARRDLEWAPSPRQGLEMALLRMLAFRLEPSQVIQNSSSQTSLDSEAKKKASLKQPQAETRQPEPKPQIEKTITADVDPAENISEEVAKAETVNAESKATIQKADNQQQNINHEPSSDSKAIKQDSTFEVSDEPPFNPDDYASFSDDEKTEDSIAEEYQSSSSQKADPHPSSKINSDQPDNVTTDKNQAALASLHSALGLNLTDEPETSASSVNSEINSSNEEVAPIHHDASESTPAQNVESEPEIDNDDQFRLEPQQVEAESSEPSTQPERLSQSEKAHVEEEVARAEPGKIVIESEELEFGEPELEEKGPPVTEEAKQWAQHVKNMDLTGSYQQIAQCSTVHWASGDKIQLTVEPAQDILCTDTAKQAIEEALTEYFKKTIVVDWQFGDAQVATPAMIWQREAKAKHRKACKTISTHPFAQQLAQKFGAKLDKSSIQYLDAQ